MADNFVQESDFTSIGLKWDAKNEHWMYVASDTITSDGRQLVFPAYNPSNNSLLGNVYSPVGDEHLLQHCVTNASKVASTWAATPTPTRADVVRRIGNEFRKHITALSKLLCLEVGKIISEAKGEIQELIDICDFAAGLGRQIDGHIFPSERPGHVLIERWHPLGTIGVITAFNFPVAVLGWNAAVALVCGNAIIWKPSPLNPLLSGAVAHIFRSALRDSGFPMDIFQCCIAGNDFGRLMTECPDLKLISFTGSTKVGRQVAATVQNRFGKIILELGGNNASLIMPDANLPLASKASAFAAVGTAGQRCTTLRRLLIHSLVYDQVVNHLLAIYKGIKIGDASDPETLCGPLATPEAVDTFLATIRKLKQSGCKILFGGTLAPTQAGNFVVPALVEAHSQLPLLQEETFSPILYLIKFDTLKQGIDINNSVPQGLSSSIYSRNLTDIFEWIGPNGSDCGLVNVNVGPSGAEIGGAFGGEKETGGGRESGSDAWKQYMRRITVAMNYSDQMTLAQGVQFDV